MNIVLPKHKFRMLRGRSWLRFGLIVTMISALFVTQLLWRSQQVARSFETNTDEWSDRLSLLLNSSETGFEIIWDELRDEVEASFEPITNITGDWYLDYEIDKLEELIRSWIQAVQPLTGYSLIDSQPNTTNPFSDQLVLFFQRNQDLLKETQSWWRSTLWWRLPLSLSPRLNSSLETIRDFIDAIEFVFDSSDVILDTLGHTRRKTYLLLTQNIGEARPTGGFMGSYIPLEVVKGNVIIGDSQSIYFVDGSKPEPIETHPATSYYLYPTRDAYSHGIRNLNFFPCWPDTAEDIAREFEASRVGFTPDGVITINPLVLEQLIPENTIIDIPEVGAVNSLNILDEIERITSFESPDKSNPKSLLSPILRTLLSEVVSLDSLVGVILDMVYSRNILLWSSDQELQSLLEDRSFAGDQTCQRDKKTSIVAPLIANISIDKRNSITENSFQIDSEQTLKGKKVTVRYSQFLPENPDLERPFRLDRSMTFVGLQIPEGAQDLQVTGGLNLPAVRPFYKDFIDLNDRNSDLKTPQNVETIYTSVTDIENGFTYRQPDGSSVVGTYVRDMTGFTHIDFSFYLPVLKSSIVFLGQPGLNLPTVSFTGDAYLQGGNQSVITDQSFIQRGLIVNI